MRSLRDIVNTQYLEYPWAINILQDPNGIVLTIIIKNLEDEREDTVVNGNDEKFC